MLTHGVFCDLVIAMCECEPAFWKQLVVMFMSCSGAKYFKKTLVPKIATISQSTTHCTLCIKSVFCFCFSLLFLFFVVV